MEDHNQDKVKHEHEQAVTQTKKSSNGAVIALVIAIILAIAAIVGTWYYMNNSAKNDKKAQDAQIQQLQKQVDDLKKQSSSDQTISYTTKYQLLKFAYENGWTIKDNSAVTPAGGNLDSIDITSPSDFAISMQVGSLQRGGACGGCKVAYSEPVTVLGKQLYINYVQDTGSGVSKLIISEKADDTFGYNLPTLNNQTQLSITAGYRNGDAFTVKDLNTLKSDANIQSFKKYLQSLSY